MHPGPRIQFTYSVYIVYCHLYICFSTEVNNVNVNSLHIHMDLLITKSGASVYIVYCHMYICFSKEEGIHE